MYRSVMANRGPSGHIRAAGLAGNSTRRNLCAGADRSDAHRQSPRCSGPETADSDERWISPRCSRERERESLTQARSLEASG